MKQDDKSLKNERYAGRSRTENLTYIVALFFVFIGLINVTPTIPGWDELWKGLTGNDFFRVRRFPTEWLYPITFFCMMVIVVLKHSIWKSWVEKNFYKRQFGLFLDVALIIAAASISIGYLIELEAVCLIDVITGDRARLVAEALQAEIELAETYGIPAPDSADDPACLYTTEGWLPTILFLAIAVFLAYNIKVWGLPLAMISILIAAYTFGTIMNWYWFGADDQNKYLITIISADEPRSLISGREILHDALVNQTAGILGRFMNILLLCL